MKLSYQVMRGKDRVIGLSKRSCCCGGWSIGFHFWKWIVVISTDHRYIEGFHTSTGGA